MNTGDNNAIINPIKSKENIPLSTAKPLQNPVKKFILTPFTNISQ